VPSRPDAPDAMTETTLSRLLRLAGSPEARRGPRCPDAERWAAFVAGGAGDPERDRLEAHLADCAACLGDVGFLLRTGPPEPAPAVPTALLDAVRPRHVERRPRWRWAAASLAGGAALALALATLQPWRETAPRAGRPATAGASVRGSATPSAPGTGVSVLAPVLLRPAEGAVVGRAAFDLEWRSAPGAFVYTVQILDARGDVLWEKSTPETRLTVPTDAGLGSGRGLFVWVIAQARSGAVARSPVVGLRIAPE
jgi:Putative zinc-finger